MPVNYCPYPDFKNGGICGGISDASGMCFRHRIYATDANLDRWRQEKEAAKLAKGHINKRGAKKIATDKALAVIRKAKEAFDNRCAVRSPVCTGLSEGTHHITKRSPNNVLALANIVLSCNACNLFIELNKEWAVSNGFLKSKFLKNET